MNENENEIDIFYILTRNDDELLDSFGDNRAAFQRDLGYPHNEVHKLWSADEDTVLFRTNHDCRDLFPTVN